LQFYAPIFDLKNKNKEKNSIWILTFNKENLINKYGTLAARRLARPMPAVAVAVFWYLRSRYFVFITVAVFCIYDRVFAVAVFSVAVFCILNGRGILYFERSRYFDSSSNHSFIFIWMCDAHFSHCAAKKSSVICPITQFIKHLCKGVYYLLINMCDIVKW
jgi:hypothetical protein